ncbi:MAG: MATE family efflux transporter [Eubacteriales bacterium]|nr:MATE family efflux transporter [Eubacteriales bacterium]
MSEQTFMKEKKVLPLVLSMSLPMVISMGVNSLYNIVDSYFVAKMSEDAMTALALVYPVQNIITAIAVGFGIGTNAVISYFLGARQQEDADRATTQGMLFNLLHGILLAVICIGVMPAFLRMFSSDEKVISLALIYAERAFIFAPVIAAGVAFEKIFQSVGRMKVSMFCMMCGFVANIILDPMMIFGIGIFPEMGIAGAAYATDIGQAITLIAYLVFYVARPIPVKIRKKYLKPDRSITAKLYGIGIPAALNIALPSFLISALNGILAGFSGSYVLVLGVYYKLQTFIYLTGNGIVQGIRPLVGYNYGAGEHGRVREIYRTAIKLTAVVMLVGTALSWTIPGQLIGMFTSNADTIRIGIQALHIVSLGFIVSAVSVTTCGFLEGMGKGTSSLCISLSRYVVVMIPAAFVLSRFMGANGVWTAFAVTEFITAVYAYCVYRNCVKKFLRKE